MPNLKFGLLGFGLTAFALGTTVASATTLERTTVAGIPHVALADAGRAAATTPLRIAVTLNGRNPAELAKLVEMQSDPASPLYRKWLTNAQFNAYFAPSSADYAAVATALRKAGFAIAKTYPNRSVIDATGNVAAAEGLFGTEIHRVAQAGYGTRYTNVRPAVLTGTLAKLALSVDGLNDLQLVKAHYATIHPGAARPQSVGGDAAGLPLRGPVSTQTGASGYGPRAFSQGYQLPNQHGKDGMGRVSGVVIDADFIDSDLSAFLGFFNVTRTGPATVRVPIDGGPPGGDGSSDSIEATLDVETIVSNAPGTALYVYEFPSFNNLQFITDAYNQVVSDNLVDTANSSFGGCETGIGNLTVKAWDTIAMQGAAKGITFHASTGDEGADGGCVEAPASGPHFVAVGGTTLTVYTAGNYESETGWAGSGGGVSQIFALPSWQAGVKNVVATGRNTPDIAFDANPNTGAAFYYGGTWNTIYDPLGGTSLASPIFGAAQTEMDQVIKGRYGLAGKSIFAFWKKNGYANGKDIYFHDSTSGNNGGFSAQPGYDQVTGIGSMNVWNFIR